MSRNCHCEKEAGGVRGRQEAVQEDITTRSSKLESIQVQLAMKKFLSEEELRVQAWAEVERTRQREIRRLWD